jgi:Zn-dependent protease with chaperone function
MARLYTASFITLSLMVGMLAGVVVAAMVASDQLNLPLAIAIVVAIQLVLWLLSPWLTDLSLRWFNSMEFLDDAALRERYPHVHRLIHEVAQKHRFSAPRIGIIRDRNPTAFTYGRARSNARIILTEGIFEFLDEEETRAVVAHELGHIVHRDFIVMTLAGVLVQVLYQVYVATTRRRSSSSKKNNLAWVGLIALVFYWIGEYLLLYLSRTREFMADRFAADHAEPRYLASALVKIAYGIVAVDDTEATDQLLKSTRHMGLIDPRNARATGALAGGMGVAEDAVAVRSKPLALPPEAMLFDIYNPWARVVELSSTHPLTARRIFALSEIAGEKRQRFNVDIASAARRLGLRPGSLRGRFVRESLVYFSPLLVAVAIALAGYWPLAPGAFAATVLITLALRYPTLDGKPSTVMSAMSDPTASPVFGRPVRLEGTPIGRVNAGYFAGEDVMWRDKTGLVAVDFRSMAGAIGNFIAGWARVGKHLQQPGEVQGWFRRGMSGHVVLREMTTTAGRLGAVPWFWQLLLCAVVIGGTVGVVAKTGLSGLYQPVSINEIRRLVDPSAAEPGAGQRRR